MSSFRTASWVASHVACDGFWDDPDCNTATATAATATATGYTATFLIDSTLVDIIQNTLSAGLDARVEYSGSTTAITTFLDSVLFLPFFANVQTGFNAVLSRTVTKTASLDSVLLGSVQQVLTTSLDGVLTGKATFTTAVNIDSLLEMTGVSRTVGLDAHVLGSTPRAVSLSLDSILQPVLDPFLLDALLSKTVTSKTVNLDARLLQVSTFTQTVSLNALIQASGGLQVNFNAVLAATIPTAGADAVLQAETTSGTRYSATVTLNAVLQASGFLTSGADGILQEEQLITTEGTDNITTEGSDLIMSEYP